MTPLDITTGAISIANGTFTLALTFWKLRSVDEDLKICARLLLIINTEVNEARRLRNRKLYDIANTDYFRVRVEHAIEDLDNCARSIGRSLEACRVEKAVKNRISIAKRLKWVFDGKDKFILQQWVVHAAYTRILQIIASLQALPDPQTIIASVCETVPLRSPSQMRARSGRPMEILQASSSRNNVPIVEDFSTIDSRDFGSFRSPAQRRLRAEKIADILQAPPSAKGKVATGEIIPGAAMYGVLPSRNPGHSRARAGESTTTLWISTSEKIEPPENATTSTIPASPIHETILLQSPGQLRASAGKPMSMLWAPKPSTSSGVEEGNTSIPVDDELGRKGESHLREDVPSQEDVSPRAGNAISEIKRRSVPPTYHEAILRSPSQLRAREGKVTSIITPDPPPPYSEVPLKGPSQLRTLGGKDTTSITLTNKISKVRLQHCITNSFMKLSLS